MLCFACTDGIDGELREYGMQENRLLERATIDCPGMPLRIVTDVHRECLLIWDANETGKVRMLRKSDGGNWVAGTLLDAPHMEIRSMCVLDANRLSIFDANSSALRIYEFA